MREGIVTSAIPFVSLDTTKLIRYEKSCSSWFISIWSDCWVAICIFQFIFMHLFFLLRCMKSNCIFGLFFKKIYCMTMTILFSKQVAAFGGDRVMNLLRIIERCNRRFKRPPIGPIGAHLVSNFDMYIELCVCSTVLLLYMMS